MNQLPISILWGTDLCRIILRQLIKVSHGNPLPDRTLVKYRMFRIFMSHIKAYHNAMGWLCQLGLFNSDHNYILKSLKPKVTTKNITSFLDKSLKLREVLSISPKCFKWYIFVPIILVNLSYLCIYYLFIFTFSKILYKIIFNYICVCIFFRQCSWISLDLLMDL